MFGKETETSVSVRDVDCGDETILRLKRDGRVFAHVTITKHGHTHVFDIIQRDVMSNAKNGSENNE
jgi:alpha-tubulin suppressor-like RCC1 family protein